MKLSQDDVIQILKLIDESSFDELHLETGDLKIVVRKREDGVPGETPKFSGMDHADALTIRGKDPKAAGENLVPSTSVTLEEIQESKRIIDEKIVEEGLISIKSPMLGTFYRASKPGEPPLVDVGAVVNETTTVCIIEVMKLFSTISAGVRGRITRICADDGQMVEYDQILFLVDPDTD